MTHFDPPSFESLYRKHFGRLVGLLYNRLGNRADAEELAQDAFTRLQRELARQSVLRPFALLRKIALNLAIDRQRQEAARRRRENSWATLRLGTDFIADNPNPFSNDPQKAAEDQETIRRVLAALDGLFPTVRDAFLLQRYYGYSHAEIAERLSLSRSTVEKHIMKAWRHLLTQMENEGLDR